MANAPLLMNQVSVTDNVSGNLKVTGNVIVQSNTNYAGPIPVTYTNCPMYTYYTGSAYVNTCVKLGRFTHTIDSRVTLEIIRKGDMNYSSLLITNRVSAHIWAGSQSNINFTMTNLTNFGYYGGLAIDSQRNLYYTDGMLWSQYMVVNVLYAEGFEMNIQDAGSGAGLIFRYPSATNYEFEGAY